MFMNYLQRMALHAESDICMCVSVYMCKYVRAPVLLAKEAPYRSYNVGDA